MIHPSVPNISFTTSVPTPRPSHNQGASIWIRHELVGMQTLYKDYNIISLVIYLSYALEFSTLTNGYTYHKRDPCPRIRSALRGAHDIESDFRSADRGQLS